MAQEISVGSLVTARRDSGVCKAGEIGVCYEVYQLGNRPGYSFIFERGGYDGFSPGDVKLFLDVGGRVSRDAARYQFRNVWQLDTDYRAGRFDAAFRDGRLFASTLHRPDAQVLSSHDRRALIAYEQHCRSHGIPATETGRNQWLNEWHTLNEEQRQDAVDAERNGELDWPQDETSRRGPHEPGTDLER